MNSIINHAKIIASKYQYPLMITLLYIGLYTSFRDLLMQFTGVFSLIVILLSITIEHGKVSAGLKVINDEAFDSQKEAASGLARVKVLWSTYGWMTLITLVIFIAVLLILLGIVSPYLVSLFSFIYAEMEFGIDASFYQLTGLIILVVNIALITSDLIFNTFLFSTPYLVETKGINGVQAIKMAYRMNKGHFKDIFKLFGHYFIYMIAFVCIEYLCGYFISSVLLLSLIEIIITVISIFAYENEFVVAKALLYYEIVKESEVDDSINE